VSRIGRVVGTAVLGLAAIVVVVLATVSPPARKSGGNGQECSQTVGGKPLTQTCCARLVERSDLTGADLPNALHMRAIVLQANGCFDQAIADYDEAIRLLPHARFYHNRGNAWQRKGELDRAAADYDEAIRLEPQYSSAFNNRGSVWHRRGDHDRASADYSEAIRLNPQYASAYANRGYIHYYRGSFAAAEADFSAALRLDPEDAYALIWLTLARARASGASGIALEGETARGADRWPFPIVRFLAGELSERDLYAAAAGPDTESYSKRHCEISFYSGQVHLIEGGRMRAVDALREARRSCPTAFVEHHGAVAELGRLAR